MLSKIENLISGIPTLGSHGEILNEMEEALNDPDSTLTDVGHVIEKDPDLTARLLKLGNSSFFGFPSRMETVSETINLIGIQQVQDLISVSVVVEIFEGVSEELANMGSFWKHSMACGLAARQLALARRVPKPEKFFVAGLLHDIGRLVLYSRTPEDAQNVFRAYLTDKVLLRDAEQQVLGFDHTEIGEALLKAWNYPVNLINAVRFHHQPMSAGPFQLEASIVHVGDHIVNALQLGCSGERWIPPLQTKAWDRLNLPVEVLESVVETVDSQIVEVERAFLSQSTATA
jgi:putative nucleotidyltransferase with HDIG domain